MQSHLFPTSLKALLDQGHKKEAVQKSTALLHTNRETRVQSVLEPSFASEIQTNHFSYTRRKA
jgi:hypothetical protein